MTRTHKRNLAARMGRWSAGHWKTATFGWLALVVVAFGIGGMVGVKNIDPNTSGPGQSGRMDRILNDGFKQPAAETVLIQSRTVRAGAPAFDAAVRDVVSRISKVALVRHIQSPATSRDGRAVLVDFDIRGKRDKAPDKIGPVLDAVGAAQAAHPTFFIGEMGDASAVKAVDTAYGDDLAKAGELSLPITLAILLVAFGALVAAGIPLLLALTAVFATFGLVALPSQLLPMAKEMPALVLLVGLAVGVDYSMFYLRREREERAKGRSERAALEAAAATSGRSVLISGLTVMVAMAGMFVTGDPVFASFGVATMMVVAVAMLGSLTVLPALLSRLGDGVDRLHVPLVGRLRRDSGEGRLWGAVVDRVLRRPLLSALISGGLLVALAVPAVQLRMADPSPTTYPAHLQVIKTYKRMQQAFPGKGLPANVIVKAPNVDAPAVRKAIGRFEQRALASGRAHEPITIEVNRAHTVANITLPIDGNGTNKESDASLALLRKTLIPETLGNVPNVEAGVTGLTAQWKDQGDQIRSVLPLVVAFVLVFAFLLMLVAFRSIVVAIKAVLLNCLSVAAAYGILVLVFQHGYGKGFLGFTSTSGVSPVIPLLLFVILFGLSMDYHVFIVSRIRETFRRGASMDEAISTGIKSTAGVVTSAALVMVCVFAVFATLSMLFFKQFGVGLASAILLDATLVRGVLLPATMKLLGERNWYLPSWLERLPHFDHGELEVLPEPEGEPTEVRTPKRKRPPIGAARITGLVLVVLAALGLAYLKFAPSGNAVSVPTGAKAGQLTLHPCHYGTERGNYAADCGTLVVKENRHDARSRLIALPVTRIRARAAHPAEPIFRLQGGPGITNMTFPDASRFADSHDVVLVGYRGVDGSSKLDCPEVVSARERNDFLTRKAYRADAAAFRACAARLRNSGVDLAGYSLPQRVDDLDRARRALGYERIDLLSESAGTRTAMIYAWRYPKRIHRSVMIGVNPPGKFLWDANTTGEQIRRYAALCARDAVCHARTPDLAAALHSAFRRIPDHFWFLPVKPGYVQTAAFFGLNNATADGAGPIPAAKTIDTLLSAGKGDGSGAWFLSLMAQVAFPSAQVWGEVAATGRSDAAAARRFFATHANRGSVIGAPLSDLVWVGGRLVNAWPANPDENLYTRVRDSNVETLLIGGELDFATPPQNARRELLPHLPNGRQVVLRGIGHTDDFWVYEPKASSRLVNTFFDSGGVDTSRYTTNTIEFTPSVGHGTIAKILLAVMLSFAALTVLSLLWLPFRVHRRGAIGRKSSAAVRTLYVVLLGLGGWFAGVLVVLATMPNVPLDDQLLAAVSIGAPIALGVYYAWVNRDWTARTRATGLAAAAAGALAGAWLGFNVVEGLFAVVTTIVGATVGANLALLVLDIVWDRRARDRFAAADVREALAPQASIG